MPRTIFLDIDDVIATNHTYALWQRAGQPDTFEGWVSLLDREIIERLNVFGETIGAEVVISSTWRLLCPHDLKEVLASAGLRLPIVGVTPVVEKGSSYNTGFGHRGYEIHEYIVTHNLSIQDIVIFDDNPEAGRSPTDLKHGARFICTSGKTGLGLLDRHLKVALKLFADPKVGNDTISIQ